MKEIVFYKENFWVISNFGTGTLLKKHKKIPKNNKNLKDIF